MSLSLGCGGGGGGGDGGPEPDATPGVDPSTPIAEVCTEGWCFENPTPIPDHLHAVWGASAADLRIVGTGPMLHWDGGVLAQESAPASTLMTAWGVSADDYWLGSFRVRGGVPEAVPGMSGTHMHGSGPDDVWVVSVTGRIARYSGTSEVDQFSIVDGTGDSPYLRQVFARSPEDAYIATSSGLWRLAGGEFVRVAGDDTTNGFAVYFAGNAGYFATNDTIYAGEGDTWTQVHHRPEVGSGAYQAIWASSPADVWVIGHFGQAAHFDGSSWADVEMPYSADAIHGFAPDDIWAVGDYGRIQRYDGSFWRLMAGDEQLAYFSDGWSDGAALWLAGEPGLLRYQDGEFAEFAAPIPAQQDRAQANVVAGDGALIYVGASLVGGVPRPGGGIYELSSAGAGTLAQVATFDEPIYDLDSGAAGSAWAVGDGGTVARRTSAGWSAFESPTDEDLSAVAALPDGRAYVGGRSGVFFYWNGEQWIDEDDFTGSKIQDLAHVDGCLFAITTGGMYTRSTLDGPWQPYDPPGSPFLYSITALSCADAWAAGRFGDLWHWDGLDWSRTALHTRSFLERVMATDDGRLWAVGGRGTILRRDP